MPPPSQPSAPSPSAATAIPAPAHSRSEAMTTAQRDECKIALVSLLNAFAEADRALPDGVLARALVAQLAQTHGTAQAPVDDDGADDAASAATLEL